MISEYQYNKWTERDVKGKKARMDQDVYTGTFKIPKGMIVTITRKQRGYGVQSEPCEHCGVSIRARHVDPWILTMLE